MKTEIKITTAKEYIEAASRGLIAKDYFEALKKEKLKWAGVGIN
jgi:hypothetical protein